MFEALAELQRGVLTDTASPLLLSLVALVTGYLVAGLVDTGVRARGFPFLCGLVGLYGGAWASDLVGWNAGPRLGGLGLIPGVAGTLAVALFVKLAALGATGPRR
jgi:hypothetical protein